MGWEAGQVEECVRVSVICLSPSQSVSQPGGEINIFSPPGVALARHGPPHTAGGSHLSSLSELLHLPSLPERGEGGWCERDIRMKCIMSRCWLGCEVGDDEAGLTLGRAVTSPAFTGRHQPAVSTTTSPHLLSVLGGPAGVTLPLLAGQGGREGGMMLNTGL